MFDVIAFDADDTLWHNEPLYRDMQQRVIEILARHHEAEWILQRMDETEIRNLEHYGYGAKGFTLSLIETAIDLTEGQITGKEINQIIALTKEMLRAPIELLDGRARNHRAIGRNALVDAHHQRRSSSIKRASSHAPASAIISAGSKSFRPKPLQSMPPSLRNTPSTPRAF
jgi:FMN phosphatase YigB (HAD superfamily)